MPGMDFSIEIIDLAGARVALFDKDGLSLPNASGEDKLLVNAKIVDYRRPVTLWMPANTSCVAGDIHTVDDRYVIESIRESHNTAADAGGAMNIGVAKGTVTAANSTAQHSTAINLAAAANTQQNVTISTQTTLDAGDRICVKNVTNTTNLAGASVTIVLKRVP